MRAALATRRDAVLVSLDGRSAYDSMSRAAFLGKLHEVAPELLPFVRMFYGSPSTYCWWDANGCCRDIKQGEGCKQGNALAPALFALGQHYALHQAATALHPEDSLVAFLDDLYVITTPPRARAALDETVGTVESRCGIASNLGKTRVIGVEAGPPPPGIAELGEDVWRSDKPPAQRGVVVLGSPVGHPAFVQAWAEERLRTEQQLLDQLPKLPDLQCAWLLLRLCASPRANHAIRTMPPSQSAVYASAHDAAVWATLQALLGGPSEQDNGLAREVAALPAALGGLGLQSAELTAPAAYWAAWADALPAIRDRLPGCAENYVVTLEADADDAAHCLAEAARARRTLQDEGWSECPTWRAVLEGARPAPSTEDSAGDWPHGWQMHASRIHAEHYRDRVLMPALSLSSQAMLRSQAGPPPYLASRPPRCRPKQCRSRCGDAYGCRSRSAPTVAGPTLDAGDQSTPLATTPSLAPERASWPVAPKWWSEPGSASPAKQSEPRARSCRSSGSRTQPPPASLRAIAGASISWFTVPLLTGAPFAVMRPSCRP